MNYKLVSFTVVCVCFRKPLLLIVNLGVLGWSYGALGECVRGSTVSGLVLIIVLLYSILYLTNIPHYLCYNPVAIALQVA